MARPFRNRKSRTKNKHSRQTSPYSPYGQTSVVDVFAYEWSEYSTEFYSNEHWGNSTWLVDDITPDVIKTYRSHEYGRLNKSERWSIKGKIGAIVHVDSQGFINVDWFDDKAKLMKMWESVAEMYESDEPEDD